MSPSQRLRTTAAEFEAWRESQRLEHKARPSSLFDDAPAEPEVIHRESTEASAIKSVSSNAGPQWRRNAASAIRAAAYAHSHLTVDDVWPYVTEQVHDSRAMGGAMRQAARDGFIERVPGAYRTSDRPETHSRPLAVWRSRIYEVA